MNDFAMVELKNRRKGNSWGRWYSVCWLRIF